MVSISNWLIVSDPIDCHHKGRKVPELNEDMVREISLYSYRIIYEIKPEQVIEVLAVTHKRQDLLPEEIIRE